MGVYVQCTLIQYDRFLRREKRFSSGEVDMDEKTFMYEEVLMFIVYTITSLGWRGQTLGHGFQHHARYSLISMTSSLAKDFRYTTYVRRVVHIGNLWLAKMSVWLKHLILFWFELIFGGLHVKHPDQYMY